MKLIKCITQFLLIILTSSVINIQSSTTDEPAGTPSEPATALTTPSTQDIIDQINKHLKNSSQEAAVDYVTNLDLDQNTLIEVLKQLFIKKLSPVSMQLDHFIISTIIANKKLHNNDALAALQDLLYRMMLRYFSVSNTLSDLSLNSMIKQFRNLFYVIAQSKLSFKDDNNRNFYNLAMWQLVIQRDPNFAKFLMMKTGVFDLDQIDFNEMLNQAINNQRTEVVKFLLDNDLVQDIDAAMDEAMQINKRHPSQDSSTILKLLRYARLGMNWNPKTSSADQGNLRG